MKRRAFLSAAVVMTAAMLSACSTTSGPRLAPERQLTIAAPKMKVKEAVAALMVSRGYQIQRDTDFVMDFATNTQNFMATLLLSSRYDGRVETRVSVTFIGDNPTQVTWRAALVTNPGSAFERPTDITNNPEGDNVQTQFVAIKTQLEK
ncbi:hypothetical protein [Devosia lacusdianchii]|uniref:hypothetical protein n=1 Tax=Devosia lacusdianchii TaxID=2917991 RepID=UPI001F053430|nr:hypothetical protein [Devosia sp. JXJ CY 41]